LNALFFGGLAFALAPLLGRGGAAGIAGIALALAWTANGLDVLGPLAVLSPFHWTANHVALVEQYDWAGLALVAVVAAAFLAIGVELFRRRDLGVTSGIGLPQLPASMLGLGGPISRSFGDQLPRALAWGVGIGVFGATLASLVGPMSEQIGASPDLLKVFRTAFPDFDLTSAGGFLQLFVQLFYIAAGFAAATFVAKWASDETDGRLEQLLATPLTRGRWVISGGIAALVAAALMTLIFAVATGAGGASGDVAIGTAMLGSASLGLYAAAVIGVGVAVGGLWRTSLAGEIAAVAVVATYLIDLLAPPLNLPDWVHQMALTAHMGQPMTGSWDPVGIVACGVIAIGGRALGALGMRRRDVAR
jgi:ABC-2 type transport system permease protein